MASIARGLYEILLTQFLADQLRKSNVQDAAELEDLRNAEAADRVALHLAKVVEAAIEHVPEDDRAAAGARLAHRLIELIVGEVGDDLSGLHLSEPAKVL